MGEATERMRVLGRHLQPSLQPSLQPCTPTLQLTAGGAAKVSETFRFTLDNPRLSLDQRRFYEDNGFIVVSNLLPDSVLDECSERFRALCEGRVPKGNMILMKDISLMKTDAKGEFLYNKAQDIAFDDVFSKYIDHKTLVDVVSCFTGPNIMAVHTMLINKPPDSGALTSKHPLHQDLHYFPFRPADRVVAAWTAMERVTEANGCLVVVPASHRGALRPHHYPRWEGGVNKAYHGVQDCDHLPTVKLQMNKGDTVFFHPLLVHGSGANTTKGFRKAISCHYAASECEYIDVTGTTQENIAEEVKQVIKRKGLDLTYQDAWRYKSRLVRGKEINL